MSDHLPECVELDQPPYGTWWCICDRLRACEQRVLDAARDAVAALPETRLNPLVPVIGKVDALAAIDALRSDA